MKQINKQRPKIKKKLNFTFYFLLSIFSVLILFSTFYFLNSKVEADTSTLTITVVPMTPTCGNGTCGGGETCSSCPTDCGACQSGGGGGGGGGISVSPYTGVIFKGKTYPQSFVTLLKDGQVAAGVLSAISGDFEIKLSAIYHGAYIFSLYGKDEQGRNSGLYAISLNVVYGAITDVSGILIAPTVSLDKEEVKKEEIISVSGQSIPNAEITIIVSETEDAIKELFFKTKADQKGEYSHQLNVSILGSGKYAIKTKAEGSGYVSNFSRVLDFIVGEKTIFAEPTKKLPDKADLNGDGKINLVDFSILLYWLERADFPPEIDLSKDGKIDFIDFSIIAFYWTG